MAEFVCECKYDDTLKRWYVDDFSEPRESVVRCRDCRHGDPFCDSSSYTGMIDCTLFAEWDYRDDKPGICPVEPDGFCAWGKERDADGRG